MRPAILNAVKRANEFYGDLDIMVTGHSMGGAMASFCGLDLKVIFSLLNLDTTGALYLVTYLLKFLMIADGS